MGAAHRARLRRIVVLHELVAGMTPPIRLLDVGGTARFWETLGIPAGVVSVTITNLSQQPSQDPRLDSIVADARALPFDDQEFDLVFSNSVIEHVGGIEDQATMAAEVRRVGRSYLVQTPNRYFPIEPHYLFPPYAQFWPRRWRKALARLVVRAWVDAQPVDDIRLLNRNEMLRIFPEARLVRERFAGLTKSLTAIGRVETASLLNEPSGAAAHAVR
jgi:hypothetical protein